MNDVTIKKGTPRTEPRDVENDAEWLQARVNRLEEKVAMLQERTKLAKKELTARTKQLDNLK